MSHVFSGTCEYESSGVEGVSVLFRNVTQGYYYHHTSKTDSNGAYSSMDVDAGGETVAVGDTYWMIFYGSDYYKIESGTISGSTTTEDAVVLNVAIAKLTLDDDVWDFLRIILTQDPDVDAAINYIGASYPEKFVSDGGGLPFVTIKKPSIVPEPLTMRKKKYMITFSVEIKANTANAAKVLARKIRYSLGPAKVAMVNQNLSLSVTGDDNDIDKRRDEKTVHTVTLEISGMWLGGGTSSYKSW